MGQITKKQHYIWRYYLSAWTGNNSTTGEIFCLRNRKIFETSLMNVAHENYFYLVKDLSPFERKIIYEIAIRKTTGIQRAVASGWLDLYCAPYDFAKTLRSSTTMQHLSLDEKAINTMLHKMSTEFVEKLHAQIESSSQEFLQQLRQCSLRFWRDEENRDKFSFYISNQYFRTKRMRDRIVGIFQRGVQNNKDLLIRPENMWIPLSLIFASNVGVYIAHNYSAVLLCASEPNYFVVGDQPVLNTFATGDGLIAPNDVELFYPITPHSALLLTPDSQYKNCESIEVSSYQVLQYLQNPDITIERLEQFLMLLSDAKEVTADPEQRKAKIKYAVFERKVKHRLKEIEVAEASRRQHDEDFISKEAIAMLVQQYIEEKFSPIISEEAKGYGELRIHCLQIDIPSDMLTEESVKGHYDDIASGLIGNLRNVLYKSAALQVVYRNSFQDDFGYIAHLNNRSASVLIGSNRAFKTRHYSNCGLLDRYLSNRKVIFAGYFNWGLLLNEGVLQICVKDIHISIRPALIKDSDAKYDSEKNVYVYNPSGISLEFTREELADYLRHKRKIVNIVVQLYIKKSEGIIGELLCGD